MKNMHNFKQKEEEVEIHVDHNVIILKSDFLADPPPQKKKIITAKGYKEQQHILKHKLKLSSLNKIG